MSNANPPCSSQLHSHAEPIRGHRHVDRSGYQWGAPAGSWTARLEEKAWGKRSNLMLFLCDLSTGQRWWLSVWYQNSYCDQARITNFRDFPRGTVLELQTGISKSGGPVLEAARIVSL